MMGGIVGRLFREFAVTLSMAIGVSLAGVAHNDAYDVRQISAPATRRASAISSTGPANGSLTNSSRPTRECLKWVLAYQPVMLIVTILVACLSVYLYIKVPKGFFPQQDTGRIMGGVHGRAGHFLPSDARQDAALREHRNERSGGRIRWWASPAAIRRRTRDGSS